MRLAGVLLLSVLIVLTSAPLSNAPIGLENTTPISLHSDLIPETTSSPAKTSTSPKIAQQNVTSVTHTTPKHGKSSQIQGARKLDLSSVRSWAYWLQNASPRVIAESGFNLVVMDYSRDGSDEMAYRREEIERIKRAGVIPVAYISIGEAEDYRFYWKESWNTKPPEWLGPENPEWDGNYAVKYWSDEWKAIIFEYLDKIIAQGFSGVYLDKVDEFEFWGEAYRENWTAEEMIDFIIEIANYTRSKAGKDFLIIPQNGERLLLYDDGRLLRTVSGWASEDVFYNGLEPSPWTEEKISLLGKVVEAGKVVLAVDYVDNGTRSEENLARIKDFIKKAREKGYIPYAAMEDRELDELNIIPGVQPSKERQH